MSQETLMKHDPQDGKLNPYPSHAKQYRNYHGRVAWLFNPWTDSRRHAADVGTDPFGVAIVVKGEPIVLDHANNASKLPPAAPPIPKACTREEAIDWCVERLQYWPKPGPKPTQAPGGWGWYQTPYDEHYLVHNGDTIYKSTWQTKLDILATEKKAAEEPTPMTRVEALEWCVINLAAWPTTEGLTSLAHVGWEWGYRTNYYLFCGEQRIYRTHWKDALDRHIAEKKEAEKADKIKECEAATQWARTDLAYWPANRLQAKACAPGWTWVNEGGIFSMYKLGVGLVTRKDVINHEMKLTEEGSATSPGLEREVVGVDLASEPDESVTVFVEGNGCEPPKIGTIVNHEHLPLYVELAEVATQLRKECFPHGGYVGAKNLSTMAVHNEIIAVCAAIRALNEQVDKN